MDSNRFVKSQRFRSVFAALGKFKKLMMRLLLYEKFSAKTLKKYSERKQYPNDNVVYCAGSREDWASEGCR